VLAVAALMLWPSDNGRAETRWRGFLDGVLVAGSLFIISWVSALGSAVQAGGDSALAYGVSLAYPVSDLILLSLTVLAVNLLSSWLRVALDPQEREKKYAATAIGTGKGAL
jgi:membrane protein implicated in regulation of membrane protease activity